MSAEADELERSFLAALSSVKTYQASDTTLTLNAAEGPVARFQAR